MFRFFLFQFHFESCKKKRNTNVTFSDYVIWQKIFINLRASTRSVQKVSSHFEYLENWSHGLDVTWQQVRGDITVLP